MHEFMESSTRLRPQAQVQTTQEEIIICLGQCYTGVSEGRTANVVLRMALAFLRRGPLWTLTNPAHHLFKI
jgi:hypothetical protein